MYTIQFNVSQEYVLIKHYTITVLQDPSFFFTILESKSFLTDNSSLETYKYIINSKNFNIQTFEFRKYKLSILVIAYLQVYTLLESPPCDECGSFIQNCSKHLKYGFTFRLIYHCVAYEVFKAVFRHIDKDTLAQVPNV